MKAWCIRVLSSIGARGIRARTDFGPVSLRAFPWFSVFSVLKTFRFLSVTEDQPVRQFARRRETMRHVEGHGTRRAFAICGHYQFRTLTALKSTLNPHLRPSPAHPSGPAFAPGSRAWPPAFRGTGRYPRTILARSRPPTGRDSQCPELKAA